jgi:hypothetical protein
MLSKRAAFVFPVIALQSQCRKNISRRPFKRPLGPCGSRPCTEPSHHLMFQAKLGASRTSSRQITRLTLKPHGGAQAGSTVRGLRKLTSAQSFANVPAGRQVKRVIRQFG